MTTSISARALALIFYSLALLVGAFAISVAVSDWRDDDAIIRTITEQPSVSENRLPLRLRLEVMEIAREEAQPIAREEAERAVALAVCLIGFRGQLGEVSELTVQVILQGCKETVGW